MDQAQVYVPLLNGQDEKRFRLDILMPLTNQPVIGMPDWVGPYWESMEKEGSKAKDIDLTTSIEGVTFEGFSTEQSSKRLEIDKGGVDITKEEMGTRHLLIVGATLRNFKLVRETRDGQGLVCLKFSITFNADAGLALWCHKYLGGTFWASFTITQASMDLGQKDDKQMKLGEQPKQQTVGICGFKVGKMICKRSPHDITVAHELEEDFIEQAPDEAKANAESFFNKDKATKAAQKAVSSQPIEELRRNWPQRISRTSTPASGSRRR